MPPSVSCCTIIPLPYVLQRFLLFYINYKGIDLGMGEQALVRQNAKLNAQVDLEILVNEPKKRRKHSDSSSSTSPEQLNLYLHLVLKNGTLII